MCLGLEWAALRVGCAASPCPVLPWLCDLGKPCWLWASGPSDWKALPSCGCSIIGGHWVSLCSRNPSAALGSPASTTCLPESVQGVEWVLHHSTLLSLFRLNLKNMWQPLISNVGSERRKHAVRVLFKDQNIRTLLCPPGCSVLGSWWLQQMLLVCSVPE